MKKFSSAIPRTLCLKHSFPFREILDDDYARYRGCILCPKEAWASVERFEILENIDKPSTRVPSLMDKYKKPKKNTDML